MTHGHLLFRSSQPTCHARVPRIRAVAVDAVTIVPAGTECARLNPHELGSREPDPDSLSGRQLVAMQMRLIAWHCPMSETLDEAGRTALPFFV